MKISLIFVTLCLVGASASKVVLQDNGYDNVVIALAQELPASMCQDVIIGLETVLRSASTVIFRATRGRASFRSVSVVLPSSWVPSGCPALAVRGQQLPPTRGQGWESADLRVTGQRHPSHGAAPWTLQPRGCGYPGHYISLGHQFFLQNVTSDHGRDLAQQWLRYRYGVFEETGEPGNPLHPPRYRASDNSLKPTSCANTQLKDSATCSEEDVSCAVDIRTEENPELRSSLMAHAHNPEVVELCDEGSHDPEAPTKHNLACGSKSVWEVMRASPDFQNNRNIEGTLRENDVVFKYMQSEPPKIVLLIDDTNVMNGQKRWIFMRKAIRKFVMFDVPDDFSVGLVVYDTIASVKHPLSQLTDGAIREKVAASLPRNPSNVGEDRRCVKCGLIEALNQLKQNGGTQGGHIILVTPDRPSSTNRDDGKESALLIKDSGVTLHAIIYPVTGPFPSTGSSIERLAASTGGQTFSIPDEGIGADSKLVMYYNLLDAMYFTLDATAGEHVLPVKVHAAEHIGGRSQSEGSFLVDPSLGANTVFTIFYFDIAHVGDVIQLESPHGQLIDTANMQKEDANINMISIRLDEAQVIPGLWRYKVENRADSHQALFVQVTSRPRPRVNIDKLSVRTWTSHRDREVNASDTSNPLALFTEVRSGVAAVEMATVVAVISRLGLNGNGSHYEDFEVELFDNGLMNPDMTRGDGVFSRLVPDITPGKYKVVIKVTGTVSGSKFARHVRLGVIDVIGTLQTHDNKSPSRVVDLRAVVVPNTNAQVTFTWTAPGGDYDYGTAEKYVIMTSGNRRELVDNTAKLLEGWPNPMKASTIQQHTITWEQTNAVHYVAMYAVDWTGNTAPLSNIVPVYVTTPPTTTFFPPTVPDSIHVGNSSAVKDNSISPVLATIDTRLLAVVFGCLGGFILVIIIIICYCTAAHKRNQKTNSAKKVQNMENGYNVTVTVGTKPDYLDGKEPVKDGIKKEYLSPVESWSASQLLSSHHDNKRGSMSGRSDNNSDHSGSTKKSYGGSSGPTDYYGNNAQYPYPHPGYSEHYPAPSDGYPTPTENYPSEAYPLPAEARSYISSQPSDSFLSVSCDLIPATHGPPGYSAYPSYDSSLRSTKVPPPIPPKPKVMYNPEPYVYNVHSHEGSDATSSINGEKRVRNVTMV